jgi:hypothetical protein
MVVDRGAHSQRDALDPPSRGQPGGLPDQVADAFDDGDEQDRHGGVHDASGQVAAGGGDVQVRGGPDERPRGPPQDRPGEPEVLGEQVPGQQGHDPRVDADGDNPRAGPEPRLGETADGGERADPAEHAQRADHRRDDGRRGRCCV